MLLRRYIGNQLFGMHSRQFRLALILDTKFLYLRGFRVGNSLNVPSLIGHVGGIFWWPQPPGLYDILEFAICIGQLNCEETITRISVALSCLSWGCFCSRDSVSSAWQYATDAMDFIIYLKTSLSKRSKCCSFMTSSRILLQKNAAFMLLLSFLVLST